MSAACCPDCGHPAASHDKWPDHDGDPSCADCLDATEVSDCGHDYHTITWLARGRPICHKCLHPDYVHTGDPPTCDYETTDWDWDLGDCACTLGDLIMVDHHRGEACA